MQLQVPNQTHVFKALPAALLGCAAPSVRRAARKWKKFAVSSFTWRHRMATIPLPSSSNQQLLPFFSLRATLFQQPFSAFSDRHAMPRRRICSCHGLQRFKTPAIILGTVLALAASGCSRNNQTPAEDEGRIRHVRNSEFSGPHVRVFLTLEDGTDVSVNTAEDAVKTTVKSTPIPGHQARDWTFVKEGEKDTAVAYALVSWDSADPADYLMAGWWAHFHDQLLPDLSFANSSQYAIVDGPELDPEFPPGLPVEGQATYVGQAGGLYAYVPGSDWGEYEGAYVLDEYEGAITLTADFANGTLSGCIGCVGDLITQRAHFGIFLGDEIRDVQAVATDYELHLGAAAFNQDGTFEQAGVEVRHPDRAITASEGFWGGSLSNLPDGAGNPRLAAGFSDADFSEDDGSEGFFYGTFVALSEQFAASGN